MEIKSSDIKNTEFLRLVARTFVQNEAGDEHANGFPFGEAAFVFPNRRAMKFFQKYLGEEFGKVYGRPFFSPDLITISELFNELSGLTPVDPVEAQYILYRNYIALKFSGEPYDVAREKEPFDEFIHWGSVIISDFNDIDTYLIDARQLFINIRDLKQLDGDYSFLSDTQRAAVEKFWNSFLKGSNNFKKESFSALWSIMYNLYTAFRKELEERKMGYEGMIYRKVAENLKSCSYQKLVFIGFNAPNQCERALMKWARDHDRGDFYWDFYGPMVTDKENKASMFISSLVKDFPSRYPIESEACGASFHVIGVPSGIGQAFVAADILKKRTGEEPIKTAVVLPDETLLMPLLNSIPADYNKINVTMGYPIAATPLVGFMNALFVLQREMKEKEGKMYFYHSSVAGILEHEYIKSIVGAGAKQIKESIVKENRIFIEWNDSLLTQSGDPLLERIFSVPEDVDALWDYLIEILKELDGKVDTLNKEFIYRYYLSVERLKGLHIPMKKETAFRLLSQLTSGITIPFSGEPLAGLQVIGSLETRVLDFDNVIILSVNEGRFPASSPAPSLIPYNLRLGFGLPTYELQDAIAAYHFYRSVYRAKNVWLIYDTRSEGLQSGEVSRYVKQLKYHYNINVNECIVSSAPVMDDTVFEFEVQKSAPVMEKLYKAFVEDEGRGLSASSLNTYLACPLKFYLEYVEGVKEEEEVEESVEASTFGTLYHNVMAELFLQYTGEQVTVDILKKEARDTKKIDELILQQFRKVKIGEVSGRNIIIKEILKKYVLLTLEEDQKYAPFIYLAGEQPFAYKLQLKDGTGVRFKAFVDRIDKTGSSLRIIDYKTGRIEKPGSHFDIPDLFRKGEDKQYKALFQLYLYALIITGGQQTKGVIQLKNGNPVPVFWGEEHSELDLVIYPVVKIKKESVFVEPIYTSSLNRFKEGLLECVEEIFNKDIPFVQVQPGKKVCEYCMFNKICGR